MSQIAIRSYTELCTLSDFYERYRYLKLSGEVGKTTFGFDRYFNQEFYRSTSWKRVRRQVILRDNGFDLGVVGYPINGKIIVHHLNPIKIEDLYDHKVDAIMNPEFLISTSMLTHQAIHYGSENLLPQDPIRRSKGDTKLW